MKTRSTLLLAVACACLSLCAFGEKLLNRTPDAKAEADKREMMRAELKQEQQRLMRERYGHTICTNAPPPYVAPANATFLSSGYTGTSTNFSFKCDSFTATDSPDAKPVVLMVLSRSIDNGADGGLYFRPITVSPDGRIIAIGEEVQAFGFHANHR